MSGSVSEEAVGSDVKLGIQTTPVNILVDYYVADSMEMKVVLVNKGGDEFIIDALTAKIGDKFADFVLDKAAYISSKLNIRWDEGQMMSLEIDQILGDDNGSITKNNLDRLIKELPGGALGETFESSSGDQLKKLTAELKLTRVIIDRYFPEKDATETKMPRGPEPFKQVPSYEPFGFLKKIFDEN